jgi:SAM-dependent methyltransferase
MLDTFDRYLHSLAATPLDEHKEHTGRSALEALLNGFASDGVHVQQEPRRQGDKGAPDFKVEARGQVLGYVEGKKVGARLDDVLRSEQIRKYQTLSGNILVTDYLEWIWLRQGKVIGRTTLAYPTDLQARTIRVKPERAAEVAALISGFFSTPPQGIGRAKDLAEKLAARSKLLREALSEELIRQDKEHRQGKLFGLLQAFRTQVFPQLGIGEFADAFAQTLAYGLFLARLNAGQGQIVRLDNAQRFVPGAFELIRELVEFLDQLDRPEYDGMRWIVDEILSIVNGLDLAAIHEDLSFRRRKAISRKLRAKDEDEHRLFERDPFIYFYEDFLKAYDRSLREKRGVYYTPQPVVNFIVRAVDDILRERFGIADGLADNKRVTVLDFACGTGTFLLEAFQQVFANIGGADAGIADKIVREHLLKNFNGFEYLIAPYTIAHLKLSQYLRDKNHAVGPGERLQVYLTNTLEPLDPQENLLLPKLSEEAKEAQEVKKKQILVILGNPPYRARSMNKGPWITRAVKAYQYVDGVHFGERKHWLQDDYVKFLRFAELKMQTVEAGVVGVITNHAWLDNATFRGMRKSLMQTFTSMYTLDLHGSSNPPEVAPGDCNNENVFDIKKGVAITIFVKRPGEDRVVNRADLWGTRLDKYQQLSEATLSGLRWQRLLPREPHYFLKQDAAQDRQYGQWNSIRDIFHTKSTGIVTSRDALTIAFLPSELKSRVDQFASIPPEEARRIFGLPEDGRSWRVSWAQADLNDHGRSGERTAPVSYRPFDQRWTFYTGRSCGFLCWPRADVMDHLVGGGLALVTCRQTVGSEWSHALVSSSLVDDSFISNRTKERGYVYPLIMLPNKSENISREFREKFDAMYRQHYGTEEVFGYIYSVLYSKSYRTRFADLLRIDFPRIPFPSSAEDFETLSRLGWALVEAHLLRDSLPRLKLASYVGKGDDRVEAVRRDAGDGTVWINAAQGFRPVPQAVWDFRIGGYQVLDKYLKSRKGRTLSLDEIRHVARICDALAFTIEQMARIDAAYLAAFPDR